MSLLCPYCTAEIANNISKDHIFPDFLGGRKTIPACARCNNKIFGARFESKAARQLLAFQMMLSSLGISKISVREGTRWARAHEHNGELYDLEFRGGRTVLVRSEPKVSRDQQGRVTSVLTRSMAEAKSLARGLKKGSEVSFKEISQEIPFEARDFAFEFGPDFGRLAMKLCAALSTLLPSFAPEEIKSLGEHLKTSH